MAWPTPKDYRDAMQTPRFCFADEELQGGQPELDGLGLPKPNTGGQACVYRVNCGSRKYAVRCFLRQQPEREERYEIISQYLKEKSSRYMAEFSLLGNGIRVKGQWFPALKMEWIEGEPLFRYVERNIENSDALQRLAARFINLCSSLNAAQIAHGDLQNGNIIIANEDFRLIDYDGMFVPGLNGRRSQELGHRHYQSVWRTENDFGPYLDNFSAWVIYSSLKILSAAPSLWRLYGADYEHLIFQRDDFESPHTSEAFNTIQQLQDGRLVNLVKFLRSMTEAGLAEIPPLTVEEVEKITQNQLIIYSQPAWLSDYVKFSQPSIAIAPAIETAAEVRAELARVAPVVELLPAPEIIEPTELPALQSFLPIEAPKRIENYFVLDRLAIGVYVMIDVGILFFGGSSSDVVTGLVCNSAFGLIVLLFVMIFRYRSFPEVKERYSALYSRQFLQDQITNVTLELERIATEINRLNQIEPVEVENQLLVYRSEALTNRLAQSAIIHATIAGIGPKLKDRLIAAGIKTAADLRPRQLTRVQGIGQEKTQALMRWKDEVIAGFKPTLPNALPANDESAIRTRFKLQRNSLRMQEAKVRKSLAELKESMVRVDGEVAQYNDVTFGSYLKQVLYL